MEAETFIKEIGESHTTNVRETSQKIDNLSNYQKFRIVTLNDKYTDALCNLKLDPENHLLAVEALLISVKYSLSKLGYLKT